MNSSGSYFDIALNANHRNWRLNMTRKADPAFLAFEKKIFIRDQHTCQYCGFSSRVYMGVVNVDSNYLNNKKSNLVTACPFCSQCHFLQSVGISDNTGGLLIYLPEMTQAELNAICHSIFSAMVLDTAFAVDAKNIYRSLRLRSQVIEKELGEGFSNPAFYGQLMIDADKEYTSMVDKKIADKIRLLPNLKAFSGLLNLWSIEGAKSLSGVKEDVVS